MKVSSARTVPVTAFVPIKVELIIESKEELHAWLSVGGKSSSVVEAVARSRHAGYTTPGTVKAALEALYDNLYDNFFGYTT